MAPALALGGVLVGLLVTGRREERRWLRDRRADAYAAVLTAAAEYEPDHELPRQERTENVRSLRTACDRANLFAGRDVAWRLDDLMAEAHGVADQDEPGSGIVNRLYSLQWAMREEVHLSKVRLRLQRWCARLPSRQPGC